jgi:hypothetical protein
MQIEYNSDWISPTIELMKCLEAIDSPTINMDFGSIDYVVDNKNGKKLIRVMIKDNNQAAPVYINTIRGTIEELDEEKYDEAVILTKSITNAAYDIVTQQKNLEVMTPNTKHSFSLIEILSAIEMKTRVLCRVKCGNPPETRDDCSGKNGRQYSCDLRRLSDDATFHATMKWKNVLLNDFYNLCELEQVIRARNVMTYPS